MLVYQKLGMLWESYNRANESGNTEWANRHSDLIEKICKELLPHGSGVDSGTEFVWDNKSSEKMKFGMDYHHMNDVGFYCGWTRHVVTITPSWDGFAITSISGRDKNCIKEYLGELLGYALQCDYPSDFEKTEK